MVDRTRQSIEDRVLVGLKERLVTPELIETFVQEYQAEYARLRSERTADQKIVAKRLAEIDRKIAALTQAIEDGFYHPDMKDRLSELTAEKEVMMGRSREEDEPDKVVVYPRLHELYLRIIRGLEKMLGGPDATAAREMIRSMIEKVTIKPSPGPNGYGATLHSELAAILAVSNEAGTTTKKKSQLPGTALAGAPGSQLSVVAGTRNHRRLPIQCEI
jgi:site-specific DNA recombinase